MIAAELLAQGAAHEIADAAALQRDALLLLGDRARREAMATAAGQWQRGNAGAVERTISVIRAELVKLP